MIRFTRSLLPALGAAALLALTTVGTMASSHTAGRAAAPAGNAFIVDDDGQAAVGDCSSSQSTYSTIQDGIDAALPGNTVWVCPGTYKGPVQIGPGDDGLTLRGVTHATAIVVNPNSMSSSDAILDIFGSNDVTVRDLKFRFRTTVDTCNGPISSAIRAGGGTGLTIQNNVIRGKGGDANFSSCGAFAGIEFGSFGIMVLPNAAAHARPAGGPSERSSGTISGNLVRDFQAFGILAIGRLTTVDVSSNRVLYGHETGSTTDCPTSTASSRSYAPAGLGTCFSVGIDLDDDADGSVTGNTISTTDPGASGARPAGDTPVLYAGIAMGFENSAGTATISDNWVGNVIYGMGLTTSDTLDVHHNTVVNTYSVGILVFNTTGVTVRRNSLANSSLVADRGTFENHLRRNVVANGACEDDTEGSGTAGTANHWHNNTADAAMPSGICNPPAS